LRNLDLRKITAAEINRQVTKVLRGLGNPKPPLSLDDVRELLKLDRQYYSKTSDGILRETVSRLKVAGKQILRRPGLLLDAILKSELKALYVPDRKIILLDETVPDIKQRWSESHEIVHSLLDWHGSVMLGDDRITLNLACHEQIEAEANFGAGRLLFLQGKFELVARDSKCRMEEIRSLGHSFGNSITSTLWRFVELRDDPVLGVVSQHPRYTDASFDPQQPCRYFIRSSLFAKTFSEIDETTIFDLMRTKCSWRKYGPIADDEVLLTDDNGAKHVFGFEAFHNRYETLGIFVHRREMKRKVTVLVPSAVAST
jgi:Zn-dependent peptidase ImmA (M78 family)